MPAEHLDPSNRGYESPRLSLRVVNHLSSGLTITRTSIGTGGCRSRPPFLVASTDPSNSCVQQVSIHLIEGMNSGRQTVLQVCLAQMFEQFVEGVADRAQTALDSGEFVR
jgi:hypothetical protein